MSIRIWRKSYTEEKFPVQKVIKWVKYWQVLFKQKSRKWEVFNYRLLILSWFVTKKSKHLGDKSTLVWIKCHNVRCTPTCIKDCFIMLKIHKFAFFSYVNFNDIVFSIITFILGEIKVLFNATLGLFIYTKWITEQKTYVKLNKCNHGKTELNLQLNYSRGT